MRTAFASLSVILLATTLVVADEAWPSTIEAGGYTVTIYQPQVEEFDGTVLESRAAVAVKTADGEPQFGAVWFSARVDTDRDLRMVYVREIEVPDVRFPEASDEGQQKLADLLEREMPS